MLCAIEIPAEAPVLPMLHDVHVFTDGSCMNQAFPTCRVASWAVVMADHDNPLLTCHCLRPFAGIVAELLSC